MASDIALGSGSHPLGVADADMEWPDRVYYGLSGRAWMRVGMIALLMGALFWPNLRRLFLKTNPVTGEANWGHSFFVPLIGLYYLYLNREQLLKAKVRPGWLGLPIMLGGLLLFAWGIWPGQNDFVKDFAMVLTLFGVVALLCGWQVMKVAWFPILFLVAAIPWPGLVYSLVALPLQQLAAKAATTVLLLSNVTTFSDGTRIVIDVGMNRAPRVLNVAEACAGMKSLMTFITIGGAVGFLSNRALWQKVLITLSAIPIALFCNMARVAGQGLLDVYAGQEWSEGFAHTFVGMVMMIPAFFLLMGVAWVLDNLFIEEVDKRKLGAVGVASKPAAAPTAARAIAPKPAAVRGVPAATPQTAAPKAPPAAPRTAPAAPATPAAPASASDAMAEATKRLMGSGGLRGRRPGAIPPAPGKPATPPAPTQPNQKKEGQ